MDAICHRNSFRSANATNLARAVKEAARGPRDAAEEAASHRRAWLHEGGLAMAFITPSVSCDTAHTPSERSRLLWVDTYVIMLITC